MAKKGHFDKVPPLRLFSWLATGKSGTLDVSRGNEKKRLFLRDGNVLHVVSKHPEDQFDAILLRENVLRPATLISLQKKAAGRDLIDVVLEENLITPERFQKLNKFRVRDITLSIFDWREGEFVFYPDVLQAENLPPAERLTSLPIQKFVEFVEAREAKGHTPPTQSGVFRLGMEKVSSHSVTIPPAVKAAAAAATAPPSNASGTVQTATAPHKPKAPTADSILFRVPLPNVREIMSRMENDEQDVYLMFDGVRSLREVLAGTKIPRQRLLAIMVGLLKSGYIADTADRPASTGSAPSSLSSGAVSTRLAAPAQSTVQSPSKLSGPVATTRATPPAPAKPSAAPASPSLDRPTTTATQHFPPPSTSRGKLPDLPEVKDAQLAFREKRYFAAHDSMRKALLKLPQDASLQDAVKEYAQALLEDIKATMVSMRAVPKIVRQINFNDWAGLNLDTKSAFVLTRIDGHMNLKQMMNAAGFSKPEICMIMYRLQEQGLIHIEADVTEIPAGLPPEDQARIETVLNIARMQGQQSFYQLLGVKPTATKEDIKKAFVRMTKELHPDTFKAAHFQSYMKKINDVFDMLNRSYDVLKNEQKREEYDISIGLKVQSRQLQMTRKLNYKAQMQFNLAVQNLKRRDYRRAAEFLESAIELQPDEPLYYLRLAEIHAMSPKTRDKAKELIQKAIQLEPHDPFSYRLLASVYEKEGDQKSAVDLYYRSLMFDSANTEARHEIERLSGKPVDETSIKSTGGQLVVRKPQR